MKGSMIMLLFSVKRGNLLTRLEGTLGMPDGVKLTIYLNILTVIVLAKPADHFSNSSSGEGPQAFGVDTIINFGEDESKSEGEGNRPKEPFL